MNLQEGLVQLKKLGDAAPEPPIARDTTLQLILSWPTSINAYWGQRSIVPKGGGRPLSIRYVTERGKSYQAEVAQMCDTPGIKSWAARNLAKPLSMHVLCYPPDKRDRDLGNLDKVLSDSLQNCGVFRNDFEIWDLRYTRACLSQPPGRVVVRLRAFDLSVLGGTHP